MDLTSSIEDLYISKGKKVVHLDLSKEKPTDEELTKLLLGPTGNLRAPTIKVGKILLVGFNVEAYEASNFFSNFLPIFSKL